MGSGSIINSIAINIKIKNIKKNLSKKSNIINAVKEEKRKKATKILKLLSILAYPKIISVRNNCFEKHYCICHLSHRCICINIDFIVERLMIESDKLFH